MPSATTPGTQRSDAFEPDRDTGPLDAYLGAQDDAQDEAGEHDEHDEHEAASALEAGAAALTEAAAFPARQPALAQANDDQLNAWIESIVDHDERALTALYDATLSRVYSIALRIVRRPALADEVVEDTYFQVWRQAARFNPARGRALTWLLGMARSRAIDAVRREGRFQHESLSPDAMPELEDQRPEPDDLLAAARGHAELHRALMLLNAQPRQLVALAFFKGLSHEEIASATELPLGTVKSQIRRAMLTLRQVLGDGAVLASAS